MKAVIAQFAKTPTPGNVKTRLVPPLTNEQALQLHKNLVTHVMESLSGTEGIELQLWSTSGGEFLDELSRRLGCKHHIQTGADLGERLYHAAKNCLKKYQAVILIGSDCPFLTERHIERVMVDLADHDLVIIPANDGGYVLLAIKHCYPEVFAKINWGSDKVLEQTLHAASSLNLKLKLLEPLDDIDRESDLKNLRTQLGYSHLIPA